MNKGKIVTIVLVLTTVILAGVAIFTALRLYNTGQEQVAPSAPASQPQAREQQKACVALIFDLEEEPSPTPSGEPTATPTTQVTPSPTRVLSPTPTGTLSPTPTGKPSPTPTTFIGGGPSFTPTNTPSPTNTGAPTATPTSGNIVSGPTSTPTTGQVAQVSPTDSGATGGAGDELPDAGFNEPILYFIASGMLVLLAAFILAF